MISRGSRAPGLAFEAVRPAPESPPLRSDVAGFIGATRRGPVGVPVRVEGWREFEREFGVLEKDLDFPYAIRGYFENGGEVAWIVRVASGSPSVSRTTWLPVGLPGIPSIELSIEGRTPGAWSRGAKLELLYRGRTNTAEPSVDIEITAGAETETLRNLPASEFVDKVNASSRLIRMVEGTTYYLWPALPHGAFLQPLVLDDNGQADPPTTLEYETALGGTGSFKTIGLLDVPEVAIVAFPDLYAHADDDAAAGLVRIASERSETLRDRMVLVDMPPAGARGRWHVDEILAWVELTLGRGSEDVEEVTAWWRAAALYHPWVRVADPLGGLASPTRDLPPSGHVAGTISLLDRDRGAHSTPANAPMIGVLDLVEEYENDEHAVLNGEGIDLLRCVPSIGFSVWGGRTLDRTKANRFVAHRRLIHRLVRAIRRVAEPLVFETNGPALWFAFVRAITAVLLEAWRAGALAGNRPAEAFNVICDETTNPPEEIELGRCVCTIEVAPAMPMEFILIRVALSRDGALEVLS